MSKAAPKVNGGKQEDISVESSVSVQPRASAISLLPSPCAQPLTDAPAREYKSLVPRAQFPVWFDSTDFSSGPDLLHSTNDFIQWESTPSVLSGIIGETVAWGELRLVLPDPSEEAQGILGAVEAHIASLGSESIDLMVAPSVGEAFSSATLHKSPAEKGGKAGGKKLSKEESAAAALAEAEALAEASRAASVAQAAIKGPIAVTTRSTTPTARSRQLYRDISLAIPHDSATSSGPYMDRLILPSLNMFIRVLRLLGSPAVAPSIPSGSWLWESIRPCPPPNPPGVSDSENSREEKNEHFSTHYAVRVFWGGSWRRVIVDVGTLPVTLDTGAPVFPVSSDCRELWPSVLWAAWWKLAVADALDLLVELLGRSDSGNGVGFEAAAVAACGAAQDPMLILTTLCGCFPVALPGAGLNGLLEGIHGGEFDPLAFSALLSLPLNSPTLGEILREWSFSSASLQWDWLRAVEDDELARVQEERNAAATREELGGDPRILVSVAAEISQRVGSDPAPPVTEPFSSAVTPSLSKQLVHPLPTSEGVPSRKAAPPRPFLAPPLPPMNSPSPILLCGISGGGGESPFLPLPSLPSQAFQGTSPLSDTANSTCRNSTQFFLISGEAYTVSAVRTRMVFTSYNVPSTGNDPPMLQASVGEESHHVLPEPYVLLEGPLAQRVLSSEEGGVEGTTGDVFQFSSTPSSHIQSRVLAIASSLDAALTRTLLEAAMKQPQGLSSPPTSFNSAPAAALGGAGSDGAAETEAGGVPPAPFTCDLARILSRPVHASVDLTSNSLLLAPSEASSGGSVMEGVSEWGLSVNGGCHSNPHWYLEPPPLPTPRMAFAGACIDSDPTLPCVVSPVGSPAVGAGGRASSGGNPLWVDPTSRDIWIPLSLFTRYFPSPLFAIYNPFFLGPGEEEVGGALGDGQPGVVALHRHWEQGWDRGALEETFPTTSSVTCSPPYFQPPDGVPSLLLPPPQFSRLGLTAVGLQGGSGSLEYCSAFTAGGIGEWLKASRKGKAAITTSLHTAHETSDKAVAAAAILNGKGGGGGGAGGGPHAPGAVGKGKQVSVPTQQLEVKSRPASPAAPLSTPPPLPPALRAVHSSEESTLYIPHTHNPCRILVLVWRDCVDARAAATIKSGDEESPTLLRVTLDGELTSLLPSLPPPFPCVDFPFPLKLASESEADISILVPPTARYKCGVISVTHPRSAVGPGALLRVRFTPGSTGGCVLFIPLFCGTYGVPPPPPHTRVSYHSPTPVSIHSLTDLPWQGRGR